MTFAALQHIIDKYLVGTKLLHNTHRRKTMYQSLFKIWAAANVQKNWDNELERFVASRNPQTHADLELAIQEYEQKSGKTFS